MLNKLKWVSNTLTLGKWCVGRVELVDGNYISVVLLPGLEGREKFASLDQCKLYVLYQVHVWLSFAGIYEVVTQCIKGNWASLGIQSGELVNHKGRINVLTVEPKGKGTVITWTPYND